MPLREEFESQGEWLFRWRSFLPLAIFPFFAVVLTESYRIKTDLDSYVVLGFEIACIVISFLGMAVRFLTVGFIHKDTSGSNTETQKAGTVNKTGIYSTVRHPLYLGNFIISLGMALFFMIWWFAVIFILVYWIYYERIMFREEEFLRGKFGSDYEEWALKTPAFIPRLSQWKKPDLPFTFKKALARDYIGIFEIIVVFTLIKMCENYVAGDPILSRGYQIFIGAGAVFFLITRFLKKRTSVLKYSE